MNETTMKNLDTASNYSKIVAQEGIILLKNDNNVLPLKNDNIAIFGRIQTHYYKSGTGSGGLVNVVNVPSILDALSRYHSININKQVKDEYVKWIDENPYDEGNGQWASEPWSQKEMIVSQSLIKDASLQSNKAIIIIGRTAGEDRDHDAIEGSYFLTKDELDLIKNVSSSFNQTVVVLNCGNIIDLSWMNQHKIDGLIMAFSAGQFGAYALADTLIGLNNPSGRLPDTIVNDVRSYPSNSEFRKKDKTHYVEDIYVGYRYFETFMPDEVIFPFGYGLSYTNFSHEVLNNSIKDNVVTIDVLIKNVGFTSGKDVIQVYLSKPQSLLGNPKKILVGFAKTNVLAPGISQKVTLKVNLLDFGSFDDSGYISKNAYILEEGKYEIYLGHNVRDNNLICTHTILKSIIIEQLKEACAPVTPFERIRPDLDHKPVYEKTPLRTSDINQKIKNDIPKELPVTNKVINFKDVVYNHELLDDFIGQLDNNDLSSIIYGEGMSSPKVTPGTAGAIGGVTSRLANLGIPICCLADGPSGIRMDSGYIATSMPCGTALASTFNLSLIENAYYLIGQEMLSYNVDILLGPGMNIHRHPLNGRNFEYFSEDPLLTGLMAISVIKGLKKAGTTGSLKHLACNNQETDRFNVDSIISQRALREIYLKGFELAVKSGYSDVIMTSYNPINGIWTASNYELNAQIVRNEWGFNGVIITDWWAKMNDLDGIASKSNTKAMVLAQNDLWMVVPDASVNFNNDNTLESINNGQLLKSHLQRSAKNILKFILSLPVTKRLYLSHDAVILDELNVSSLNLKKILINKKEHELTDNIYIYDINDESIEEIELIDCKHDFIIDNNKHSATIKLQSNADEIIYYFNCSGNKNIKKDLPYKPLIELNCSNWYANTIDFNDFVNKSDAINVTSDIIPHKRFDEVTYAINLSSSGKYIFEFEISTSVHDLAQVPFSIFIDNQSLSTLTVGNTNNQKINIKSFILMNEGKYHFTLRFNKVGIKIHQLKIIKHG